MPAYDKYIEGDYYESRKSLEKISKGKQRIIDVLRREYPDAFSADELKGRFKIRSEGQYPGQLAENGIIGSIKTMGEKERLVTKYYFEDYNFIFKTRTKEELSLLAPGYFQYAKGFLNSYDRIRDEKDKELEGKIHSDLTEFLDKIFKKSGIRPRTHHMGVDEDTMLPCGCGYDHEARDFIRATLLRLIDDLETHPRFINFMEVKHIIEPKRAEELRNISKQEEAKPEHLIVEEHLATIPDRFKKPRPFSKLPRAHRVFGKEHQINNSDDIPEDLLGEIYHRDRAAYNIVVEEYPNYISKTKREAARELPDGSWLRTRAGAKRISSFCMDIKKIGKLSDTEWRIEY